MSYYDRVGHGIQIGGQRLVQFTGMTLLLSLIFWACLLHWYFPDSSWTDLAHWSWDVANHSTRHWRAVFALCLMLGAVLTGWLFTIVALLGRLRVGERHHRGSRVVHHEQD